MQLRKLLLRVMIWSLAAAAVVGAVAILTNGSEIAWRIAGTTTTTAVCAAVLMAASLLLDKETSRAAGLVGMGAALLTAMLSLLLIWDLDELLPTSRPEETCGLTIAFLLICTLPAMAFLRGRHAPAIRIASKTGLVLTILTFGLLMIPSWFVHEWIAIGGTGEWYPTAAATGVLGLLAVACLVSIHADKRFGLLDAIRWLGVAAAVVAWAIIVYAIWEHITESSGIVTAIISVACVVAHANLSLLAPLTRGQRWIRIGTIAAAIITAICVDILAFNDWTDAGDQLTRLGGAAGFVASCGTLALIILARINRPMANASREYREASEISVICPGCRSKTTLPVGGSACPTCHLRFTIRIDEPRCVQCDYMLFMLTSDKCPECGTPIGERAGGGDSTAVETY